MRAHLNSRADLSTKIRIQLRIARTRATKLIALLADGEYRRGLREGVAASVEHAKIPFRDDIRTVIDVGASHGQFALFASRRFPKARIVSFEPLPGPREDLSKLLSERVDVRATAVGATVGTVSMNVARNDDSSSALPIGARQSELFPGSEAVDTIEAPITTLDQALPEAIERPCLLKVDVQGLELEVLRGATQVLTQVDEALIECSFIELYEGQALADEVIAFAHSTGLRLVGIHGLHATSEGRAIQADLHFVREQAG